MNINWSNLILTLLGTLTGGFITWIVTNKSLKKQFGFELRMKRREFEFERKMKENNDLKRILKALITIKREMKHNVLISNSILNLMNKNNWENWDFNDGGQYINLINTNWIEFNHELVNHELKESINDIESFYYNISLEITNNATIKSRIEFFVKRGEKCINILDENIKFIKDKIEEIDK